MLAVAGPTLTLRPPDDADAAALLALGSDPEVTRWFSWGPYRSLDEPLGYIAQQRERRERGEQLDLLIVHAEHGPVGVTGLSEFSARDRRATVGTWLGRAWWGTGVNAEAKMLILHLAFADLGLARVGAYTDVGNVRSQRALERLGFRREGVLRHWHRHGDEAKDVAFYGLLAEEWEPGSPVSVQGSLPPAFAAAGRRA